MSAQRSQVFITDVRNTTRQAFDAIKLLKSYQKEWNYGDYENNLSDGTGFNSGITKTEVGPCVFAAADALMAVLDGGQGENLAKLL